MPYETKTLPISGRKPDPDEISLPLVGNYFKDFIKEQERSVEHLYKDTKGKTTIGVGFHVPTAEDAYKLGLYHSDGRKASLYDVKNAYQRIDKRPKGNFSSEAFNPKDDRNRDLLDIRMHQKDIDRELDKRLKRSEEELLVKIPRFNQIPFTGRQALLDMQYNIGSKKFTDKTWPNLFGAIGRRDWAVAAKESNRIDVPLERNQTIKSWFMEADRKEKERRER